jgi:hypothetical protein
MPKVARATALHVFTYLGRYVTRAAGCAAINQSQAKNGLRLKTLAYTYLTAVQSHLPTVGSALFNKHYSVLRVPIPGTITVAVTQW